VANTGERQGSVATRQDAPTISVRFFRVGHEHPAYGLRPRAGEWQYEVLMGQPLMER